ncbi:MAG: peptide MFS transporter [Bradyrhizobiaceae bacterium]|nr:peptide MFS transporter [Bradyrhizobiaceae bacterium]
MPASPAGEVIFGHPKGLAFLFGAEMWERFSYYGMRALLTLYLVKYLLLPGMAGQVVGLAALKRVFESVAGSLDVQPFASAIYGTYTGLVYLTPVVGGMLADRVLGRRRTVIIGALLMAAGHFMMAFEPLLLLALLLLIMGNGAFKPNTSTQVGELYGPGDPRRDRAYSIFYVGINIGAFLAPLVCGTLGEKVGWHYGFGAAGIGMLIGLATYLAGTSHLPSERFDHDERHGMIAPATDNRPLDRDERRSIIALLILFVPVSLFWATYEQQGNTIALWADAYTDRTISLGFSSFEIPTTWFQAFNPFMIFAFTPLVIALWTRQAARRREPSTIMKMAFGCLGCGLSYLILALAARHAGAGKASWLWLFAYFVVITTAELYLSPTGLSLVSKVAPARYVSAMMGVWLATSFVGNFIAGWLGGFWSGMAKPDFFVMIAAVAVAAGLVIWAFDRPLRATLGR